ncbi:hypothetical protein HK104_009142 [Borealophlyctis nickersoniae]|nr:hypothetical protein HK104_009142 [Borealophlyctis nickersoniae]
MKSLWVRKVVRNVLLLTALVIVSVQTLSWSWSVVGWLSSGGNALAGRKVRSFGNDQQKAVISDAPVQKTVLVGLLTIPEKIQRRALIRSTYLQVKPDTVDFVFVFGRIKSPQLAHLVGLEQRKYGDILVLDCEENMNDGKTWHFFKTVATMFGVGGGGGAGEGIGTDNGRKEAGTGTNALSGPYQFVMKADDDVYLHLPNLDRRLRNIPATGTYFGREVVGHNFMAGMGYAVSWDIVSWIGSNPPETQSIVGQEDAKFASWLRKGKKVKNWVSENQEFYDDPLFTSPWVGKGWAHEYTPGTILIHRCKDDGAFLNASAHFLGHLVEDAKLSPGKILSKVKQSG